MIRYIRDGQDLKEFEAKGSVVEVTAEAMRLIGLIYKETYAKEKEAAGLFKFLVIASILSPASGVFDVFDSNT